MPSSMNSLSSAPLHLPHDNPLPALELPPVARFDAVLQHAALPAAPRGTIGLRREGVRFEEQFVMPGDVRAALVDLNGSVSLSERSYREALRRAAERCFGTVIPEPVWRQVLTAWHLSDAAIARHAIRGLKRLMPDLAAVPVNTRQLAEEQRRMLREDDSEALRPLPVPGIQRLVAQAHSRGMVLALVTGSEAEEGWRTLRQFGLKHCFSAVISALELPADRRKPHEAPYRAALARVGLKAEECLAFEDSVRGALSAYQAGVTVVLRAGAAGFPETAAELRAGARACRVRSRSSNQIVVVRDWEAIRFPI